MFSLNTTAKDHDGYLGKEGGKQMKTASVTKHAPSPPLSLFFVFFAISAICVPSLRIPDCRLFVCLFVLPLGNNHLHLINLDHTNFCFVSFWASWVGLCVCVCVCFLLQVCCCIRGCTLWRWSWWCLLLLLLFPGALAREGGGGGL